MHSDFSTADIAMFEADRNRDQLRVCMNRIEELEERVSALEKRTEDKHDRKIYSDDQGNGRAREGAGDADI